MEAAESRADTKLYWRTPQTELRFDLSRAKDIEALAVTLSADPLPGVDPSVPLMVQFNGGDMIEIPARGQGFDSTIELDRGRVRETGNILRVSHDARCDAAAGGYKINLQESRLDVAARPATHQLQLRELEARFASRIFAPTTIGLVSGGSEQTKLQALAAQGVGLRTRAIPDFRLSSGEADLDLIMVRRAHLFDYTDDPEILFATGPQIALSASDPNRLFLTGDTDAEVMFSVSAFAQSFLPASRLSTTTPFEMQGQAPLDADRHLIEETAKLDLLSVQTGTHREYVFDVADPMASSGELTLRLTRDNQTRRGTRLMAKLNGRTLGEARMRGRRTTVSYTVPPGLLVGSDNRLELTTQDADLRPRCGSSEPFIAIGEGSELYLDTEKPTPRTDLSILASTGSVFSEADGAQTLIVLPERDFDFTTSLKLMARLAHTSGTGWTKASFVRGDTDVQDKHILRIEPFAEIERHVRLSAPRGLQAAWHGLEDPGDGDEIVHQFASLDGEQAMIQTAQMVENSRTVQSGGVAALYPNDAGYLVAIISNMRNNSFAEAVGPLLTAGHWNKLQGAVSQWDQSSVFMAQTAFPMPSTLIDDISDVQKPSLTQRAKAVAAVVHQIDWPEPEPTAVGDWLDAQWTLFSSSVQVQAETAKLRNMKDALSHKVGQLPATARHLIDNQDAVAIRNQTLAGWQTSIADMKSKAAEWRDGLWRHLGIQDPHLKSAGFGQTQLLTVTAILSVLFLMSLVGMAFVAPARR
jgi:hypothetical protein